MNADSGLIVIQGAPPWFTWSMRVTFGLMASLCAWIAIDTRRALGAMLKIDQVVSRGFPRWLPRVNPENKYWIWFYKIDAAVVALGIVWMFVTGRLPLPH